LREWSVSAVVVGVALVGVGFAGGVLASRRTPPSVACQVDGAAIERRLDQLDMTVSAAVKMAMSVAHRESRVQASGDAPAVAPSKPSDEKASAAGASVADEAAGPSSPEQAAASMRAKQVLEHALAVHQWGTQDREAMRVEMGRSDDRTRQEIIRRLSAAINSGEVALSVSGPAL